MSPKPSESGNYMTPAQGKKISGGKKPASKPPFMGGSKKGGKRAK